MVVEGLVYYSIIYYMHWGIRIQGSYLGIMEKKRKRLFRV